MHKRQWRNPSPALAVSAIALFVALGGTTYAATSLPRNSVGTKQLKNNAVSTAKIKNGAVTAAKINPAGLSAYLRFGGTLPSGVTETGAWGFGTVDGTGGGGSVAQPVATFRVPLPAGLDAAHAIYVSGASAAHCSGPGHADSGYLCVYQGDIFNAKTPSSANIFNPEPSGAPAGIGAEGWSILLQAASAGAWDVFGTYAVTAP